MSRSHAPRRFGRSLLGVLLAAVMTLGLSGVFVPAGAAQGLSPLQLCLALFPNGISGSQATAAALQGSGLPQEAIDAIVAAAAAGDMTCYDIFGGAPPEPTATPTEEPTVVPTEEPTEAPVEPTKAPAEPTKAPTVEKTKAPAAESTVTALPITGNGPSDGTGLPAAGLLLALAALLAIAASIAPRFVGARNIRR